jgi:hypothetical protein
MLVIRRLLFVACYSSIPPSRGVRAMEHDPEKAGRECRERSAGASAREDLAPEHAQHPITINLYRFETRNFQSATDGTFHGLPSRGNFGFELLREHELVFKMAEWQIVVRLLKGLDHG